MSDQNNRTNDEIAKQIVDGLSEGATIAEIANVKKDDLETLYALAYQHYTAKNYKDAAKIFKALCMYDHLEKKYYMGHAASLQALGEYEDAVQVYGFAAMLDGLVDPKPFYYSAICLLKAGKKNEAKDILDAISELGEQGNDEHNSFKSQAKLLLDTIKD